jgi:hypothetical protein
MAKLPANLLGLVEQVKSAFNQMVKKAETTPNNLSDSSSSQCTCLTDPSCPATLGFYQDMIADSERRREEKEAEIEKRLEKLYEKYQSNLDVVQP